MKTLQYVGDNYIFSVWCETSRYQCLENLLDGLAAAVVPLGHKWPLMSLLDCVSKKYWVLLSLMCSGPSIALCFVWQLRCYTSSSSQFLIFPLIILYTAFLNFPLPSVSPNIISFFIQSELCIICPKYFNLLIVAKVSRECLGIIWLVTDAFVLLTLHGIISLSFICFPLHPHNTAGKTVYSSLTFVLVETSKSFMIFVKFAIAVSSILFFSWSLHCCNCHWWWEPPKTCSWLLSCYLHHLKRCLHFPQCSLL